LKVVGVFVRFRAPLSYKKSAGKFEETRFEKIHNEISKIQLKLLLRKK
jgi:hypothetical protein